MTKLVVILGFLVSFAAGVVIGSSRLLVGEAPAGTTVSGSPSIATTQTSTTHPSGDPRRSRSSYLTAELGLTSEQRAQLDGIWSAMAKANDQDDRRRTYRRERDEAIADLVPAGRLAQYDEIINTYHERIDATEHASREAFENAVEQTKAILTPAQRARYEELMQKHRWGPGASARDRQTSRRAETRATSQPDGIHVDGTQSPSHNPSHESLKGEQR